MSEEIKYRVCGTTEDGYDWYDDMWHLTVEAANAHAESWAKHEPKVWVEKITTTREIIRSISSAPKEAWPV